MKYIDPNKAISRAEIVNLDHVRQFIEQAADMSPTRKRDLMSALNTYSKWTGKMLSSIPATHQEVRNGFNKLSPGGVQVSKGRFANVRSGVINALLVVNAPNIRRIQKLGDNWKRLFSGIEKKGDRYALSRFGRYCTARSINPDEVDDAVSSAFLDHLTNGSPVAKPEERHQAFCRSWNRLVTQLRRNDLRQLEVPKYAKRYGIERDRFPLSLRNEIDEYYAYLTCSDPLADKAPQKPLRKASAVARVKQLFRCASALVQSGYDINEIDSLSVLVEPDNVRRILRFFIDRSKRVDKDGRKLSNKMTSDIAQGLGKVALRFLEVPKEQMDELRELKKMVKVEMKSMTPNNREILRKFNNDDLVDRFKSLPWLTLEQVLAEPVHAPTARRLQKAVAMIILMHAPMRLKNLCDLHLEQHLNWTASRGKLLIVIPGDEVKNEEELSFELPTKAAKVISAYIEIYRPLLLKGTNSFLFPGENGREKSSNNLSQQLAKFTFDGIGIRLTAHRFRHLMGKIFLDACPGQYEVVRRVLGHRSIDTTISYYAGEETRAAVQHFQDKVFDDLENNLKRGHKK